MAQAQRLATVLRDATRQIAAAIPLIRTFKDINDHMVEVTGSRTRATGSSARPSPRCSRAGSTRWW